LYMSLLLEMGGNAWQRGGGTWLNLHLKN